jgi:hypothetical protein
VGGAAGGIAIEGRSPFQNSQYFAIDQSILASEISSNQTNNMQDQKMGQSIDILAPNIDCFVC